MDFNLPMINHKSLDFYGVEIIFHTFYFQSEILTLYRILMNLFFELQVNVHLNVSFLTAILNEKLFSVHEHYSVQIKLIFFTLQITT